ncbi:hypothetical protein FHR34_007300 [Kitasatospora kifunensis]|uniref:Uncharacterized protein n=1 Tax=Kitasatospora kifunensis TaxID=58351 RepID=A0A7W7RAC5_KITKI|nr:hypothetical protein [Kitasatospora kifunensis]MBB4928205.1 hypothetical protein [Kitasatospora kifunensis]
MGTDADVTGHHNDPGGLVAAPSDHGAGRDLETASVQLGFEWDLVGALEGSAPGRNWLGLLVEQGDRHLEPLVDDDLPGRDLRHPGPPSVQQADCRVHRGCRLGGVCRAVVPPLPEILDLTLQSIGFVISHRNTLSVAPAG